MKRGIAALSPENMEGRVGSGREGGSGIGRGRSGNFQFNNMCDELVNFNTDWLVSAVSLFRLFLCNISI